MQRLDWRGKISRRDLTVALFLSLLALLIFAERFYTRHEPLERDMPAYAVAAHEVRLGRKLYSDLFDQKPPAIYITYGVGELLFGYGGRAVFLLGLIASIITLIGLFVAGSALSGRRRYGLLCSALYAVVCSDLYLQANQPNAEAFINACLVWAIALLVRPRSRALTDWESLVIGGLFALATLYKTIVLMVPLCVLSVSVIFPPGSDTQRHKAVRAALLISAVILGAWALTVIYFALDGRFGAFYYAMVTYNQAYSGSPINNLLQALHRDRLLPHILHFGVPIALLTLSGGLRGWHTPNRREWLIFGAWVIGSEAAIALPGKFFPHYYQIWIPLMVIGTSWAVDQWLETAASGMRRVIWTVTAMVTAFLCLHEAAFYRLPPSEWSHLNYGNVFLDSERVAHRIDHLLKPDEVFYDASIDPELYFLTKRRPPSGILNADALTSKPRSNRFASRVLRDLMQHPPELVTIMPHLKLNPIIGQWLSANYVSLPPQPDEEPFVLLVRRGGALSTRLNL